MQGQESFQIVGDAREESATQEISDEDIATIMEKTGCTEKQAKETRFPKTRRGFGTGRGPQEGSRLAEERCCRKAIQD